VRASALPVFANAAPRSTVTVSADREVASSFAFFGTKLRMPPAISPAVGPASNRLIASLARVPGAGTARSCWPSTKYALTELVARAVPEPAP
jgi:hypothetical protein